MLDWMDVTNLSFNCLLLLERVQISWLPAWDNFPKQELAVALKGNPAVDWYLRNKAPEVCGWLDEVRQLAPEAVTPDELRAAEILIMRQINDWLIYVIDPDIYDHQPFMSWEPSELTSLVDFSHKTVIDIGSGTGKQTFIAAQKARYVYAVEPVGNLRRYISEKAKTLGCQNVFTAEGTITEIPFPDGFADVVTCGHVFGDNRTRELDEMERAARPGGMVILIPGASQSEMDSHNFLVERGYQWKEFIEPPAFILRKYWKTLPGFLSNGKQN
jgi:SAM-dependent methyltransferase